MLECLVYISLYITDYIILNLFYIEKSPKTKVLRLFYRGRGIRTPMNGFGDRHTAVV